MRRINIEYYSEKRSLYEKGVSSQSQTEGFMQVEEPKLYRS